MENINIRIYKIFVPSKRYMIKESVGSDFRFYLELENVAVKAFDFYKKIEKSEDHLTFDFKPLHDLECIPGNFPFLCEKLNEEEKVEFWEHFLKLLNKVEE
jgi:hypothetical protein